MRRSKSYQRPSPDRLIEKKNLYTSGEAAHILGVSVRTICNMQSDGRLSGHRIQGSGDRRITHESLLKYARESGMKCDFFEAEMNPKVILVSQDGLFCASLKARMASINVQMQLAVNSFDAGSKYRNCSHGLIDCSIGESESDFIASCFRRKGLAVRLIDSDQKKDLPGIVKMCSFEEKA